MLRRCQRFCLSGPAGSYGLRLSPPRNMRNLSKIRIPYALKTAFQRTLAEATLAVSTRGEAGGLSKTAWRKTVIGRHQRRTHGRFTITVRGQDGFVRIDN